MQERDLKFISLSLLKNKILHSQNIKLCIRITVNFAHLLIWFYFVNGCVYCFSFVCFGGLIVAFNITEVIYPLPSLHRHRTAFSPTRRRLHNKAFLITALHGARYKTGKTLTPEISAL